MASTRWEDTSFSVGAIGSRTDPAGAPVDDLSAEEHRLVNNLLTAGYLDNDAFIVAPTGGTMSVRVGSGTAKADRYVVPGTAPGQGNYLVRLDVGSKTISIDAAATSGSRVDEVWLVVEDQAYETNGRSLPRLAYRKGTVGGGNPGPETAWKARSLLARITVPANASSIVAGNISDQRARSAIRDQLLQGALGRTTTIEETYGAVLLGEVVHTGGTNPTFSGIDPVYHSLELVGQFRFSEGGKYNATFRLNGSSDPQYFSMATTKTAAGAEDIDSNEEGINLQAGRYGSTFSNIHARFTSISGANRISVTGQGFGRHGAATGSRYVTAFGGYFVTNEKLNTIRFNVGGPMTTDGTSRFRLYGYK